MKEELYNFLYAISFYTRIPVLSDVFKGNKKGKSIRYISVVGWIIGLLSCIVFFLSSRIFSLEIAILFSILSSVLITGALHEDGLADVCDGFGGGWTKEKILLIMKDSRIGVYGALGLIFVTLFKFLALLQLIKNLNGFGPGNLQFPGFILFIFSGGHGISRYFAALMMLTNQYVTEENTSKSKSAIASFTWKDFIFISIMGMVPFIFEPIFLLCLVPLSLVHYFLNKYFNKWIGGYTGDCLGATQQITEVIFYLGILVVQNLLRNGYLPYQTS